MYMYVYTLYYILANLTSFISASTDDLVIPQALFYKLVFIICI